AVDTYIPEPERPVDKPFLMPIEDVFTIEGRGTVTTGRVERGKLKRNEEIEIVGIHPNSTKTVVTGIEMFHKDMDECQAGDNVGMESTLGEPIGIEQGLRFAIREGGKTVGAGVVTEVIK